MSSREVFRVDCTEYSVSTRGIRTELGRYVGLDRQHGLRFQHHVTPLRHFMAGLPDAARWPLVACAFLFEDDEWHFTCVGHMDVHFKSFGSVVRRRLWIRRIQSMPRASHGADDAIKSLAKHAECMEPSETAGAWELELEAACPNSGVDREGCVHSRYEGWQRRERTSSVLCAAPPRHHI